MHQDANSTPHRKRFLLSVVVLVLAFVLVFWIALMMVLPGMQFEEVRERHPIPVLIQGALPPVLPRMQMEELVR